MHGFTEINIQIFLLKAILFDQCANFCNLCLQHDLDEMLSEARLSEEKARSCMVDAARLAEELRAEQAEPVFTSVRHGQPFALIFRLFSDVGGGVGCFFGDLTFYRGARRGRGWYYN